MYDWLDVSADESRQILTASRRLARVLKSAYAAQQIEAGSVAWATPDIEEWRDWAYAYAMSNISPSSLPILLSAYQSKLLWERCLRREISDPLLNVGMLARQARDTWLRLREWCVPLQECQRRAANKDQWLFAKAASGYQSILDREGWVDEAGIPELVIAHVSNGRAGTMPNLVLAGFDRISPRLTQLITAWQDVGGTVEIRDPKKGSPDASRKIVAARDSDAELRAAGYWARQRLDEAPDARIGVVVTQLEKNAQRSLRLVKEGLIPGWQNAGDLQRASVNMSYGRKLVEYPVIDTALLVLGWVNRDLGTAEVSRLLRSSILADAEDDARIRAELELRRLPDQHWPPARVLQCVHRIPDSQEDPRGGLRFIKSIAECRKTLPKRQSPAAWVTAFSELLDEIGWPGETVLSSPQFQTVNRWRELLNEVARLELINGSMTLAEVVAHLSALAGDSLFQPEGDDSPVSIMGPLEAAGLEFDAVWVTGASTSNWPPQGNPLALLARDLQRDYGFPDAVPADTVQYAQRVLDRLAGSAPAVVFSFAEMHADAEQAASALVEKHALAESHDQVDPGWHASTLVSPGVLQNVDDDPPPAVVDREKIHGGAATIQRQFVEPFSAFASGRLGILTLWPIEPGLPANIRGSLIHDALYRLYLDCPTQQQIRQWQPQELGDRITQAVEFVFAAHERNADTTIAHLLQLEKLRVSQLLHGVVDYDLQRDSFGIAAVEQRVEARIGKLDLHLRIDRVDVDSDGRSIVIDYKTGSPRKLLDRDKHPKDMQLVVYARALGGVVAGMGLMNIDSRQISLDAAGKNFPAKIDWDEAFPVWRDEVDVAAGQIARGDLRVNVAQAVKDSRPFGLLSRVREMQHEQ